MTRPVLPLCSVRDCNRAAGAIIDGALLCGEHAVEELERREDASCAIEFDTPIAVSEVQRLQNLGRWNR